MADPVLDYLGSHSLLTLVRPPRTASRMSAPVIYVNDGTTVYFGIAPALTSASNLSENPVAAIGVADNPDDWNAAQGRGAGRQRHQAERRRRQAGRRPLHAAILEPGRRRRPSALLPPAAPRRALCRQQVELGREERSPRAGVGHERRAPRFFRHLRPDEVDSLSKKFSKESFKSGTTMIEQGTAGDRFYLIVDGVARTTNAQGEELSTSGPGGFVGEIAILADRPRTATVTAATDVNGRLCRCRRPTSSR